MRKGVLVKHERLEKVHALKTRSPMPRYLFGDRFSPRNKEDKRRTKRGDM
ncbi:hypothetical protein C5S32_11175 [ANME-1 cluster archaeon GoMg1]|nr:hypothetical protein [ANME-1 cluster archaeon GoMg1]